MKQRTVLGYIHASEKGWSTAVDRTCILCEVLLFVPKGRCRLFSGYDTVKSNLKTRGMIIIGRGTYGLHLLIQLQAEPSGVWKLWNFNFHGDARMRLPLIFYHIFLYNIYYYLVYNYNYNGLFCVSIVLLLKHVFFKKEHKLNISVLCSSFKEGKEI